jgi:multiple sugar transport system ATP-binding protein
MASVTISNARKSYGVVPVLHGVSVDIADGEFVALVGPSGCGKSTLLRMIAGLETIDGGEVRIGSTIVNDVPPKARNIAMVFQSYALYPHMTVADNMGFSLKLGGMRKAEIRQRIEQAADILDLRPLLERMPKQLSGGQRQRVAMGRAIVRDPAVFLFDEPLSNLDAKLRVQMRSEIKALHQRLGTTTIYVTHDQVEAMTMADRVVVMQGGRLEQIGRPLELYDHPDNLFVAGFIGSPAMNLITGALTETGSFRTNSGVAIPLSDQAGQAGAELVLGVRPEHIELAAVADPRAFPATIVVTEPTGSETLVVLSLAGETIQALFRNRIEVRPGDLVHLAIMSRSHHLFDKSSGNRLM